MATAIAALLGATALLSAAPASAGYGRCGSGDFCLFFNARPADGVYHFGGSDSNLGNDRFEGAHSNQTVANNALYAWNNALPTTKRDVLVYTMSRYRGASDCIKRGDEGLLPINWWNTIESYRWVTRASCNAAGVIDLR
jgi:hypothetical protein